MKERGLLLGFVLTLFLTNLVSAQYFGSFSLGNLLNSIPESTMVLGVLFIISFALINFALSRVFRDNKTISGIISLAISLLIIWGVNRTGFDFEGIFDGLGISGDALFIIFPFILIIGIIILGAKFGFSIVLLSTGGLLILLALTPFIYEKLIVIIIGAVLLLFGWFLRKKKGTLGSPYNYPYRYPYPAPKKKGLFSRGAGTVGRGIKTGYGRTKDYMDPRNREARYQEKRQVKTEKRLAKENLQKSKEIEKAPGQAIKEDRNRTWAKEQQQAINKKWEERKKK